MNLRTGNHRVNVILAEQQHTAEFVHIINTEAAQVPLDVTHPAFQLHEVDMRQFRGTDEDDEVGRELREVPYGGVREDVVEGRDQYPQIFE